MRQMCLDEFSRWRDMSTARTIPIADSRVWGHSILRYMPASWMTSNRENTHIRYLHSSLFPSRWSFPAYAVKIAGRIAFNDTGGRIFPLMQRRFVGRECRIIRVLHVKCYPGRATAGRKINRFPYIQRLWGNASFVMRRSISFLNGNLDGVTRHLNFLTVRSGFIKEKGNHNCRY